MSRFATERLRTRYLASRVALRRLLAERTGVDVPHRLVLVQAPGGKPRLEGSASRLTFSLARSDDIAVVALADAVEVGVDVEIWHPLFECDAFRQAVLSLAERRAVDALPAAERPDAVQRLWVRKEAIVKARGTGFTASPASIDAGGVEPRWADALPRPGAARWADVPVPCARAAVAIAWASP